MSVQDKQLANLLKRQSLFKVSRRHSCDPCDPCVWMLQAAALAAKQQGQTDTAREYLKQALSFNKLIEVSKAGLPVEMGTLPVPPQMQVWRHTQPAPLPSYSSFLCLLCSFAYQT